MSSPVTFLTDFSDRISPMLVKELRQGMRAKTFVALFLSLQIFLAVMLFSAGASSSSSQVGSVISGIIFSFFSIAVVIVQPLRGTGALSTEIKGNTIDMMVLTKLSAWRIVFGKWVAIVGQSALLFSTIFPYLILRYFFGGMNLFGEMVCLILIFLTSMALTAVTVGLSGCTSVIIRSLFPLFGLPTLTWMLLLFTFSGFRGSGEIMDIFTLSTSESRWGVAAYVGGITYLGGSMLSLGASLIAPAAENHSLPRRLVALAGVLILMLLNLLRAFDVEIILLLVTVVTVPAVIIALTDSAPLVRTVCMPFVKWGRLGRIIGSFFYPTWSSGILFAITLSFLAILGMILASMDLSAIEYIRRSFGTGNIVSWNEDEWVVILSLLGGLLFPAVLQAFLFRGEGQRVAHYLLVLAASFIVMGVLTGLADSMNSGVFLWFFAWNPLTFIVMQEEARMHSSVLLVVVATVDLAIAAILLFKAFLDMRKCTVVIEDAVKSLEPAV